MTYWGGKSEEEWDEFWRQERLREDAMLAFHDEIGGRITQKALAAKFGLKPTRVSLLIRRRTMAREREALLAKIERLETTAHIPARASTFTAVAERLWMELEWLATELEKRRPVDNQSTKRALCPTC
jgi:hypothetical protein